MFLTADLKIHLDVYKRQSYYTAQELTEKMHNYELEKSGHVIWHLDYGMSGVGSNSCGPELLKQYRLNEEKMHWELVIG